MSFERAPLFARLEELWRRVVFSLIVFLFCVGLSYYFSPLVLTFLVKAVKGVSQNWAYVRLPHTISLRLSVAFFSGFVLFLPFFSLELARFLRSSAQLESIENSKKGKNRFWFLISIPLLFYIGAFFAYSFVCPLTWRALLNFDNFDAPQNLQNAAVTQLGAYLSVNLRLMFVFGLAFQLPILIVVLNWFQLLSEEALRRNRKYAFLLLTIIAALVTPADLITPISLIIPTYLLYEATLALLRY